MRIKCGSRDLSLIAGSAGCLGKLFGHVEKIIALIFFFGGEGGSRSPGDLLTHLPGKDPSLNSRALILPAEAPDPGVRNAIRFAGGSTCNLGRLLVMPAQGPSAQVTPFG